VRGNPLQKRKNLGRSIFGISLLVSGLFWVAALFFSPPPLPTTSYLPDFFHKIPFEVSKGVALGIYLTLGYLLIPLNNKFGLIQIKASLQTSVFFFFISACPNLQKIQFGAILPFFLLGSLYTLFKSYQVKESSSNLFRAFLYLGLASLFIPQLLFLVPILLLAAITLQTLTVRSFFASLFGYLLPYWFLFTFAFVTQQMDFFYDPIKEAVRWYPDQIDLAIGIGPLLTTLYIIIMFTASTIYYLITRHRNKLSTRAFLSVIITISLALLLLIILQPIHLSTLFPSLLIGVSILVAHFFALTKGKVANTFFAFSAIGLLAIFIFNLWTHL